MEVKIPCPIHTSEFIQRVNTDINAAQKLYCLECILQQEKKASFIPSNFKTIPELIELAANFYKVNKNLSSSHSQIPSEYVKLMSQRTENLEKLSQHIEEEKNKVIHVFNLISQDFLRVLTEKKNQCVNALDQQLANLHFRYIHFDKQLKKVYFSEENTSFLFPSKEELTKKLEEIANSNQLSVFVRNLTDDLNEQDKQTEKNWKFEIETLSKNLTEIQDLTPSYEKGELDIASFMHEIAKLLDKIIILRNPTKDVSMQNYIDSKIVSKEEFDTIKEWIPQSLKLFGPKLLFRASQDGFYGKTFHDLCDGKKNTITLIKAQFEGNEKINKIGGFMDRSWNSDIPFIYSDQCFLFSVTNKTKCPVKYPQCAGYYSPNQGPSFGEGNDLAVMLEFDNMKGYVCPHSYMGTASLVDTPYYGGEGDASFKALEVEVYCLE